MFQPNVVSFDTSTYAYPHFNMFDTCYLLIIYSETVQIVLYRDSLRERAVLADIFDTLRDIDGKRVCVVLSTGPTPSGGAPRERRASHGTGLALYFSPISDKRGI